MKRNKLRTVRRKRRKIGIRKLVVGTADQPRLTVFRSIKHVYAQLIDDINGRTLVAADSRTAKLPNGGNKDAAQQIGTVLAERAKEAGISRAAFDRNGYHYHGRVQALAEAAREGGLRF